MYSDAATDRALMLFVEALEKGDEEEARKQMRIWNAAQWVNHPINARAAVEARKKLEEKDA